MSLQNQVIDSLINGAGSSLLDGELVRISANQTVARTNAATLAGIAGFVGAVSVGAPVAPGGRLNVVVAGVTRVRMQTGLTLTAGQTVYLSATVAGAGTNVAPGTNAVALGVIKDTTGYTVSNPYVTVDLAIAANGSNTGTANWDPSLGRFFLVDYDNGSDANVGYIDAAKNADLTGLTTGLALKTLTRLRQIMPSNGAGLDACVLIKPRAAGANYLKPDGVTTDDIDFRGLVNYGWLQVRGSDLTNSASDKITLGGITFLAGPNGDGSFSAAGGATTFTVPIAAGALTAEPGLLGYRTRFTGNVTPALANSCAMVWKNTAGVGTITFQTVQGTAAAAGDRFFIERPGVSVNSLQTSQGTNTYSYQRGIVVQGIHFKETTTTTDDGYVCQQSAWFSFCEWDRRGPNIKNALYAVIFEFAVDIGAKSAFTPVGGSRLSLSTQRTLSEFNQLIGVQGLAVVSTNQQLFVSQTAQIGFGLATVMYGTRLDIELAGQGIGPNNSVANNYNYVGAKNFAGFYQRLRMVGIPGQSSALIRVRNTSAFQLWGVDCNGANAIPCVRFEGSNGFVSIDDIVSTDGGNTDVAFDMASSYQNNFYFGLNAANTINPGVAQCRGPGGQTFTYTVFATAPGRDYQRNSYMGTAYDNPVATASLPAANALPDGSFVIENGGAGVRNLIMYESGQRFRVAGGAAF